MDDSSAFYPTVPQKILYITSQILIFPVALLLKIADTDHDRYVKRF